MAVVDTALGLLKKLAPFLLKEGKFVLAYKKELNKLESNLVFANAFLADGRVLDAADQNSPSRTMTFTMIIRDVISLASEAVSLLESIDRQDQRERRKGKVVKCINGSVVKCINPVVLFHHYKRGRRLCRLNQRFEEIEHHIQVKTPVLQQELSNIGQQLGTYSPEILRQLNLITSHPFFNYRELLSRLTVWFLAVPILDCCIRTCPGFLSYLAS